MMRRNNRVSKSPAPKRKRLTQNPKLDAIRSVDSPAAQGSCNSPTVNKSLTPSEKSDSASQPLAKVTKEVCSTDDKALQQRLVAQATGAVTDFQDRVQEGMDYVSAAMRAIRPQEGVEDLLAAQIVGMHTLAMEFMLRAAWRQQPDLGVEANLNRAVKAVGAVARLTEALSRYRGKAEQKMTVEHVHVHKGGQAIVGAVSQSNTQNNTKVRSGADDSQ
jgi:hypothetical protein